MADPLPVLVIDDSDDTLESLTVALETSGLPAVGARNGREALMMQRAGLRPCLIVLNLMMPVMNGYEFRESAASALESMPPVFAPHGR